MYCSLWANLKNLYNLVTEMENLGQGKKNLSKGSEAGQLPEKSYETGLSY